MVSLSSPSWSVVDDDDDDDDFFIQPHSQQQNQRHHSTHPQPHPHHRHHHSQQLHPSNSHQHAHQNQHHHHHHLCSDDCNDYCAGEVVRSLYEGSKANHQHQLLMKPFGLSYARRPSGTNNHSTVPLLHRRTSSGSSSSRVPTGSSSSGRDGSQSLPSENDEDGDSEGSGNLRATAAPRSKKERGREREKRDRNRASLPLYFSLLAISRGDGKENVGGGRSVRSVSHSPSTPKILMPNLTASMVQMAQVGVSAPPRGRERSRSPAQRRESPESRQRWTLKESKSTVEKVFDWTTDWTADPLTRRRFPTRRNSSPSSPGRRGRLKSEELDEDTFGRPASEAPGFGSGRSGLKKREKDVKGLAC
jgi:hypothetical protein